jgi:flavodoxin
MEDLLTWTTARGFMKPCVFYFSRTGNTKRLAEALSESLKVPAFDIVVTQPSVAGDYDLLIVGTPVTGFRPAVEVTGFLDRLPDTSGKTVIVFCTYAVRKGSTLNQMSQQLAKKGYETVLAVGKRGVKPSKTDFQDVLDEMAKALKRQLPSKT